MSKKVVYQQGSYKVEIELNGEKQNLKDLNTISDLLNHKKIVPTSVVVEQNGNILNHPDFIDTKIKNGDKIEIVHFVGGG